jgi:hypothetical protein
MVISMCVRDSLPRLLCLLAALAAIAAAPTVARAGGTGLLVPSYFYPGTGGPGRSGDGWAAMAAAAGQVAITVVLNPESGPGRAGPAFAGPSAMERTMRRRAGRLSAPIAS